jgi:GTP-binding protein HflX
VRDISHPESREQKADVEDILGDLGVPEGIPVIEVWNKIDRLEPEMRDVIVRQAAIEGCHPISAVTGEGLDVLLQAVETGLGEGRSTDVITVAYDDGRRRAWLFDQGVVVSETGGEDGHVITVRWSPRQAAKFFSL